MSILLLATTTLLACQDDDTSSTEQKNILTFSVPAGFGTPPNQFIYNIIVSDDNGNVLGSDLLHAGTTYKLSAPKGFTGKDVTLTLVHSYKTSTSESLKTYLYTYTKVPFGDYGFRIPNITVPPPTVSKGRASASLSGVDPRGPYPRLITGENIREDYNSSPAGSLAYDFNLYLNKADILFSQEYAKPWKYIYREITPDNNLTFTMNDMVAAQTKPIAVPANADADIHLALYGTNAYGTLFYFMDYGERTSSTVVQAPIIPEAKFTSIQTYMSATLGNEDHNYIVTASDVPTSMKVVQDKLTYSRTDNTITLGPVINADVIVIHATTGSPDNFVGWMLYSGGNTTVTMPKLPQALVDAYGLKPFSDLAGAPRTLGFLYDYTEYDGYTDYLNRRLTPSLTFPESTEYMYYTVDVDGKNTGGRTVQSNASPSNKSGRHQKNSEEAAFEAMPSNIQHY